MKHARFCSSSDRSTINCSHGRYRHNVGACLYQIPVSTGDTNTNHCGTQCGDGGAESCISQLDAEALQEGVSEGCVAGEVS